MTTQLERVVRPFQAGDVFNARPAQPVQQTTAAPDVVNITWGKGIPSTFLRPDSVLSVKTKASYTEQSRETETVRIFNPQDPSQFVDVEQATKITLQKVPMQSDTTSFASRDADTLVFALNPLKSHA